MIQVRMMPLLAKRARSHRDRLDLPFRPDCTAAAILSEEGFTELDQEGITALINDNQVDLDHPLSDGDHLELLVAIQGG